MIRKKRRYEKQDIAGQISLRSIPGVMLMCHFVVLQLLSAMVAKLGNREDPLPQELFEGVDEDEWVKQNNNNFEQNKSLQEGFF